MEYIQFAQIYLDGKKSGSNVAIEIIPWLKEYQNCHTRIYYFLQSGHLYENTGLFRFRRSLSWNLIYKKNTSKVTDK